MYQKTAKRSMIVIGFFMFIINFLSFQVGISQSNPQLFFRDGVVINTEKEMMFVSNKETVVEALELRSGKRIWSANTKGKPLFYLNDILYVQGAEKKSKESLLLVGLNPEDGKSITSFDVQLPKNVESRIINSEAGSFYVNCYSIGNGVAIVWHYKPALRGANFESEVYNAEKGVLFFDGETLKPIKFSDLPKSYDRNPIVPSKKEIRTEKRGVEFLSKDGKHVLVSKMLDQPKAIQSYSWNIYDRSTKKRIGSLLNNVSYAPFLVKESTIIFEQPEFQHRDKERMADSPLQLIWLDFKQGEKQFAKIILNSNYRGKVRP